jgi:tetratricopeptide (TPR) repeat protein
MRIRARLLAGLVAVAALAGVVCCDEPPKPADQPAGTAPAAPAMTPEQAADAVLTAWKEEDEAAIRALAEKDALRPWLVVDEILFRGLPEAARKFASFVCGPESRSLVAYVDAQRAKPYDSVSRNAILALKSASTPEKAAAAILVANLRGSRADSVGSILVAYHGARAHQLLGQDDEAVESFLRAADAAERLGWLWGAQHALEPCAQLACARDDARGEIRLLERQLNLAERLDDRNMVSGTQGNLGSAYWRLGDFDRALDFQLRSLRLTEALGNHRGAAITSTQSGISMPIAATSRRLCRTTNERCASRRKSGTRFAEPSRWPTLARCTESSEISRGRSRSSDARFGSWRSPEPSPRWVRCSEALPSSKPPGASTLKR